MSEPYEMNEKQVSCEKVCFIARVGKRRTRSIQKKGEKGKRITREYPIRYVRIPSACWDFFGLEEYAGTLVEFAAYKSLFGSPLYIKTRISSNKRKSFYVPATTFKEGELVKFILNKTIPDIEIPPASLITVIDTIIKHGPLARREIIQKTGIAPRTLGYALRELMFMKIISKTPNLGEMRQPLYWTNLSSIEKFYKEYGVELED
ncbi:MAG: hypothetical protein ACFFEK_16205 [Candidatus Thorarchaeota archaeon]